MGMQRPRVFKRQENFSKPTFENHKSFLKPKIVTQEFRKAENKDRSDESRNVPNVQKLLKGNRILSRNIKNSGPRKLIWIRKADLSGPRKLGFRKLKINFFWNLMTRAMTNNGTSTLVALVI